MEPIEIHPFTANDGPAFRLLNEEWIQRYFSIEEKDRRVLGDPQTYILNPGGRILLAHLAGTVIGCCALEPTTDLIHEVTKMAVSPAMQGRGAGKKLLLATIDLAREMGVQRLYIVTNHVLTPAIGLYERCGFRHVEPDEIIKSPYARADVYMEMNLNEAPLPPDSP